MSDIRPLTASCGGPSVTELRRLDTGDLAEADRARLLVHTESCDHCRTVLGEFAADRAALRIALPFTTLEHRLAERQGGVTHRWRRLVLALLVPAGALAAGIVLAPALSKQAAPATTHLKGGGPALDFVVKSGDALHDGRDGEALKTGDALRFRYSADGLPYVLIVGVDADGRVFPYLAAGDRSAKAEVGAVLSPNAIVLDSDPRPERVYAIYSKEPIAVDEIQPAAHDGLAAAHGHIEQLPTLPGFSTQASLLLNKATQ